MTVQFAHRSIFDFLTGMHSRPKISSFHVDLQNADHHCGEICMTYLFLNDFQTTLARSGPSMRAITPVGIAEAALGHHGTRLRLPRHLLGRPSNSPTEQPQYDVTEALASYKRGDNSQLLQSHPFLSYAMEHWMSHTRNFSRDGSKTWRSWEHAILEGHALAQTPWQDHHFNSDLSRSLFWAVQARHKGVLRLVDISHLSFYNEQAIMDLASDGDLELLDVLLEAHVPEVEIIEGLRAACKVGRVLDVHERTLVDGAETENIPLKSNVFKSALERASYNGHLQVMEKLIAAGAEIGRISIDEDGGTTLLVASSRGDLLAVEQLLEEGTDVNARPAEYHGRTALQVAAQQGHLHVVERLLAARADINADPAVMGGRTALQAAAHGGHLQVLERLLAAGANINAGPAMHSGRTALQAAAQGGYLQLAKLLLEAGATINANPAEFSGKTALQAAAEEGHIQLLDLLLEAGADVDNRLMGGLTALQRTKRERHSQVVKRLRARGIVIPFFIHIGNEDE